MEQAQFDHLKGAVEALLFVSERPVTIDQLKEAVPGSSAHDLKEVLAALEAEYLTPSRGISVLEIAGGWQMLSNSLFAGYIREFYKTRQKEKLSRPGLETLAIIAYKQPVSRTDVELLRGVNSDGVVMHLLNKGLIKIAGRKEVPGRPYVYGTTQLFLEYFGLRSLEDLPRLEEFPALTAKTNEVPATPNPEAVPVLEKVVADAPEVVAATEAHLEEELAKARTKLDIEELEYGVTDAARADEDEITGEASGQARLMGDAPADSQDNTTMENGDGPDKPEA
jgi:segregation and condensation protein B